MGSIEEQPEITSSVPIVDFSRWNPESSLEERLAVTRNLVAACRDVGFVYITNHGVPEDLLDEAFAMSKRLFDLPKEEKMKAPHPPGWAHHRGYSWPGLEKVSSLRSEGNDEEASAKLRETSDFKESYEIGSEDNAHQPNIWIPESSFPGFRDFMLKFHKAVFEAAQDILRAIALGIGLDEEHLLPYHSDKWNQLRLLHYPPIAADLIESQKFARMPAHTDWGSITLLFQDDCGGLEIESPDKPGRFIPAPPMKGAVSLNIGDLLMRWSNDYLKSTLHRVNLPPLQDRFTGNERMTRARYAIPYFITTSPDALIAPLPSKLCVNEERPAKYEPITQRDYGASRAKMQY